MPAAVHAFVPRIAGVTVRGRAHGSAEEPAAGAGDAAAGAGGEASSRRKRPPPRLDPSAPVSRYMECFEELALVRGGGGGEWSWKG